MHLKIVFHLYPAWLVPHRGKLILQVLRVRITTCNQTARMLDIFPGNKIPAEEVRTVFSLLLVDVAKITYAGKKTRRFLSLMLGRAYTTAQFVTQTLSGTLLAFSSRRIQVPTSYLVK